MIEVEGYLLQENGGYLLQENGGRIIIGRFFMVIVLNFKFKKNITFYSGFPKLDL